MCDTLGQIVAGEGKKKKKLRIITGIYTAPVCTNSSGCVWLEKILHLLTELNPGVEEKRRSSICLMVFVAAALF